MVGWSSLQKCLHLPLRHFGLMQFFAFFFKDTVGKLLIKWTIEVVLSDYGTLHNSALAEWLAVHQNICIGPVIFPMDLMQFLGSVWN